MTVIVFLSCFICTFKAQANHMEEMHAGKTSDLGDPAMVGKRWEATTATASSTTAPLSG